MTSFKPLAATGTVALFLIALITGAGDLSPGVPSQGPNTWVDIVLVLAGAGALGTLLVRGRAGALRAWFSVGAFGALALLSALSIAWSVTPDVSWAEAGRTLAYGSVFLIAFTLARRFPRHTRAAVSAVGLSALALCAWALVVKVFGLNLYDQPHYGRLLATFDYWNATGLSGSIALGPLIFLAARRNSRLETALAGAGISLAISVVIMSYSRSALAGALVGALLPLFFLAARRRAVLALALGGIGAVPIAVYGSTQPNLTGDYGTIYVVGGATIHRGSAELVLGLITLGAVLVVAAAGYGLDRVSPPARAVRLFDLGLRGAVAAVPVAVIAFLVVNHRGPFGEIAHLWDSLTGSNANTGGDQVTRFGTLNNSRSDYWHQAWAIGGHHLLAGTGPGSFDPAYRAYPQANLLNFNQGSKHAHSYVLETFAALGLVGFVLLVAQFGSWVADARFAVSRRSGITGTERDARWALIAVVLAFGVNSAIDWTWFIPGVVVPALVGAGWISGLRAPAGVPARKPLSARPGAILGLTGLAVAALALAWGIWQPLRSSQSVNAAQTAAANASSAAWKDAHAAAGEDPLALDPLRTLADLYNQSGNRPAAEAEYTKMTQVQPSNPQAWTLLGQYRLCRRSYSAAALALGRASVLDLTDEFQQRQMLADAQNNKRPASVCAGI
ncbi:MAG: O-antigen ligase family protein [Solirubrobacterales bacterium]|nr:O-antigen ligase family protein [Solirubrobacterales bacterium]